MYDDNVSPFWLGLVLSIQKDYITINQECTNPRCLVAQVTVFCIVVPTIFSINIAIFSLHTKIYIR
jgi:hypothetical protein